MSVQYTPSASVAGFSGFSGVSFVDPGAIGFSAFDPDRVDAKYFLAPVQSELMKLIQVVCANGGALQVFNSTGSTLQAGPVNVSGYRSDDSANTNNPIFYIQAANSTGSLWANAILLSPLATGSGGVAYLAGNYTSSALNTLGATVGDPVYLKAGGGETLSASPQIIGRVKTLANPGQIAGYLPTQIGVSGFSGTNGVSGFSGLSAGGGVIQIVKYKMSDTNVISSTTLVTDADLQFSIGANEVWAVTYYLKIETATTAAPGGDTNVTFNGPASPNSVWLMGESGWLTGPPSITAYGSTIECQSFPFSSFGWPAGPIIRLPGFINNGANAGTVTLKWAQTSSHAENNTLKAGSYLIATKLS